MCAVREEDPVTDPTPVQLVTVYRTGDAALIPLIKSILDQAGIEYAVKGEQLQDLFGVGRAGADYNVIVGPAEFEVRAEDESQTRELLSELTARNPLWSGPK
jgi:hypothetical protein